MKKMMPGSSHGVMPILVSTHNAGKLCEYRKMSEGFPVCFLSLAEKEIDADPEETGATFDENALIKARAVYAAAGGTVLADDSGLCVDALNGAPGIYSSRFAGVGASDGDRVAKLLGALDGLPAGESRHASFRCSIAVIFPSGEEKIYRGRLSGMIALEPHGVSGFGYDPVFIPEGDSRTLAEMTGEEKNALSHRGRALAAFFRDMGWTDVREGAEDGEA